jgi:sugar lactone lactonase YvrE
VDSAGIYVSDDARNMVYLMTPGGALQTVAGSYASPLGLAVDSHATIYIADSRNAVIREVSASGAFSTLAGVPPSVGSTDGPASQAEFYFPAGIVRDSQGNLFITDANNNTIREITAGGVVSTFADEANATPFYRDATGTAARFFGPEGITIDAADNLYITDSGNGVIRKVTPGAVVTTIAGNNPNIAVGNCSSADGTGKAAGFCLPDGIVLDGAGNLYVADTNNNTIRKITPGGVVTTFAGSTGMAGSADGIGAAARFNSPGGLAIDGAGNLYLADSANHTIRKITPGAAVTTLAGTPGVAGSHDGTGSAATFSHPIGVALDAAGNLYVTGGAATSMGAAAPSGRSPRAGWSRR